MPHIPNRPTRLRQVFQSYQQPVYFVTFRTHRRRKVLANTRVHEAFCQRAPFQLDHDIAAIGTYVLMPDHVHLFIRPNRDVRVGECIRHLKQSMTKAMHPKLRGTPVWQDSFFDHLIRKDEFVREKEDYVLANPVRAGLCEQPDEWPWSGAVANIRSV